jgi:glycosyltransferase involved in cell wall biosynthesis
MILTEQKIAVLLPCYNEERTIADVIKSFQKHLAGALIYVYDNNSTDNTIIEATKAGAIVRKELRQGKGSVVRRMFADIEADIYVMADGDLTYDASKASILIKLLIENQLDMVIGARKPLADAAFRHYHQFGNRVFNRLFRYVFQSNLKDIFSGYRVFSRRFVKTFPKSSVGFEVETDLSIHALELKLPIMEVPLEYAARPEGSTSKLRTFRDGFRILLRILILFKEVRPFLFFSLGAAFLASISVLLGVPIIQEYLHTGLVPRYPTAILATGIMILAFLSFFCGMILDSLARSRKEIKRLFYLQQ